MLNLTFLSGALLTFHLFTGVPGQGVFVASPLSDWAEHPMRLAEVAPGEYALSIERPWLHELQYKFLVNGRWQADPANPDRVPDGQGGVNSRLAVPFDEDPLLAERAGVPRWLESRVRLTDLEGAPREVTVLSPPPALLFESGGHRLVTVYFQDGDDYLEQAGARNLIANLSTIPGFPLLTAVFIPPKDREREYECLDAYADFTAGPLVREIETRFPSSRRARDRVLLGPSLGGLISLYTALRHPEVFARAASQSGSLWWGDGRLVPLLQGAAAAGLRLFLDVGLYEDDDMLRYNRQGADVLRATGADFRYAEFPSTHDFIAWRNRLSSTLDYLLRVSR